MLQQPVKIFIGWDSRFPEPALVLAHSFRWRSRCPLDIRFLDARHLRDCYGWEREVEDRAASTEFTYSRFLVPWLCDYAGLALFVDNDCVALGDVSELFQQPMDDLALRVVQHDYTPAVTTKFGASGTPQGTYPRKNWSSVMLLRCDQLKCWTPELVATASGARLHRFEDIPDEKIGKLDPAWNRLTYAQPGTKLLHYTEGGPYLAGCEHCPDANIWHEARNNWLRAIDKNPKTCPLVPVKLNPLHVPPPSTLSKKQ